MKVNKKGQFLVSIDKGNINYHGNLDKNYDNCAACDKIILVTENAYEVTHFDYDPVLVCSDLCADFYILSKI